MRESSIEKKNLEKKIDASKLFIVLGTGNYIDAIKNSDNDIINQIMIARKFNKPFFIIIDSMLSKEDKKYLGEYFSKDNIIKRMEVNIGNRKGVRHIAREIKRLTWEVTGDVNVRIVTDDSEGDKNNGT